jgi:biotin operon repressor
MMQRADLETVHSAPGASQDVADRTKCVLKLSLGFSLDRLRASRSVFNDDLMTTLVFGSVTQGNVAHLDDDEALMRDSAGFDAPIPDEERRVVSGYSIALRLGAPRETVRRKIQLLMTEGYLRARDGGYYAPAEVLSGEVVSRYVAGTYAASAAYFQGMAALGVLEPEQITSALRGPLMPRLASRAFTRFAPTVLEPMQRLCGGERSTGVVFMALVAHGLEPRGTQPLSALKLAARLGMARETTRRHLGHLAEMKLIGDCAQGPSVPAEVLETSRVRMAFERMWSQRPAFLARLAAAGILAPLED